MSESRTGSPVQEILDETLPCFESTSLPQDVFDLQNEYARINQEAEQSSTRKTPDERYRSNNNRSERRNSKTRNRLSEQSSASRIAKERPEELAISSEHEDVFRTDGSLSTPSCSKAIQNKSPSTGTSTKETAEDKHRVKNEGNNLSLSLPSNILKSEFKKDIINEKNVKRKPRRTSEPTQEVAKMAESEVGEDAGIAKVRAQSVRTKKSVSTKTGNNSSREKSENKQESLHVSSLGLEEITEIKNSQNENESVAVKKDDSTFAERFDVSPTIVFKSETGQCNKRINKKERDNTKPMSASLTSNILSTSLTGQEPRINSATSSKTMPIKLPSHLSSEERRNETAAAHDDAIVVASESYDSACSKCQQRDKYMPSSSYCLNCAYYLCNHCLRRHNRIKSKTNHHIMQGNRMPGSFTVKQYEKERKNSEKCSHHPNRNIKCFCIEHCSLCCTECKSTGHATCKMQHLEHLLIQTPDVRKLKYQTSETSKLKLTSLLKLCTALKLNKENMVKENNSIIQEVQNKSSLMTEHIKKLEKDFIEYISKRFSEAQSELDKDIEECESSIKVISGDIQYLDEPKATKESKIKTVERVKHIGMKRLPERIQNQLKDEDAKGKTHEFNVDVELFRKVTEATSLGELIIISTDQSQLNKTNETENSSCIEEEDEQLDEPVPKFVSEFHSISGWTEGDINAKTCFTAIELLGDGTMLVSDLYNMKIKWFDSEFSLIKAINISSEPWGITRTYANKYIVTLPMETSYQEIELSNGNMNLGRKVNVGIECICAVQTENQLLFAGIDDDQASFLLTDIDGTTKEQLFTGQTLQHFKRPNHLLKSLYNPKVIFVSDVDTGVFAVDIDQKTILFHYTNSLKCPMGMAMTDSGHLYICSQQTHSLHCISKEGQFLYSVPLNSIVDMRTPQFICHLPHLNEFLLTTDNSYSFVRFKLN